MQRSEQIWGPNAEQFNPDNFLPEHFEKMHAFSYLPFSGGPRHCIGKFVRAHFVICNRVQRCPKIHF